MSKIWLTSDTHFEHDKDFVWKARGFENVSKMNQAIVKNWNAVVGVEDTVYLLGDVMLGDRERGLYHLKQLKGNIYIAFGNHDTDGRIEDYLKCHNVRDVQMGYRIKVPGKRTAFLTHYPTVTDNMGDLRTLNFYGHTHQENSNFFQNYPNMYHVGMDSHSCTPVLLEDALEEMKVKKQS